MTRPPINSHKVPLTKEQQEENRRIRLFKFLTDLTCQRLYVDRMTLQEAREAVEELREIAERMFPGKQSVFSLVIEPRMERIIVERFGCGMAEPQKYS